VPVWGGTWSFFKYMLRHPFRGYVRTVRDGFRAQARVGTLTPFFPLEAMVESLDHYSEPQLRAIKRLSEVQVRRAKAMITDNPAVKLGVPLGSAYGLLEAGNRLFTAPGPAVDEVRALLTSPATQEFMSYLLGGFLIAVFIFAIQYLFLVGPMIGRAELLDDVLLVALEGRRFAESPAGQTSPGDGAALSRKS
jgi:hypothetical protein